MKHAPRKTYWKGPAERDGLPADETPNPQGGSPFPISRRRFLEAAGFTLSLAAVQGCSRAPVETALPFVDQPEGVVPGKRMSYASTCTGCAAGCGLLVSVRDGRPLKMEGLPEHPLSKGGLCAIGQALPLGLYDSRRLKKPLLNGKPAEWSEIDGQIIERLKNVNGPVRFVTSTVASPTLKASIDRFLAQFEDARHVTFDAVSSSAILDSHEKTHGSRVLPRYRFERADVIVSFGADFLGTWISPVEFTAGWRSRRIPTEDKPEMSYHVQFEGGLSLTGSNADRRYRLAPDEYRSVLKQLHFKLAGRAGSLLSTEPASSPIPDADLVMLVDRLWAVRGRSLVLSDSQEVGDQVLVNAINEFLGNYGNSLDLDRPSRQRQGNDGDVLNFLQELQDEKVAALFVAGTDLVHDLPGGEALGNAIKKVKLVVSFSEREDDISSLAQFVCPDHHILESWLDAEPVDGIVSLNQPLIRPLGDTRSILASLATWSGKEQSTYEILQTHWKTAILPRAKSQPFQRFWDQAVHDGFVEVRPASGKVGEFQADTLKNGQSESTGEYCLSLYSKVGLTDSRHAHNPWLQELPDPVTKVTWDNYVCLSPKMAEQLDVETGDVVDVSVPNGTNIQLPALIQPGQHDRVLAIALAYGVKGTDRFANIGPDWLEAKPTVAEGETVGKNAAVFLEARNGALQRTRSDVALEKTGKRHELASTQEHHSIEMPPQVAPHGAETRDPVQETTLPAFAKNPAAGKPEVHVHVEEDLWPDDHPKEGNWWGMAIDLNACTGCSACLIACQSENNVPVVGKDEVARQREMHWIRIDRYYAGEDDELDVLHQPMMCQHCDHAPCETVCPVLATVHGEEGLNEQAYNRCVGTRYCANNCPYKVRRFNWFEYPRDDKLQNLALNPDVSVRSRGVMEKCSFCVQRIQEEKIEAKAQGAPLADGEIQTACQQSCPAQAITFGNRNDPESAISKALENPRRYGVLEEFNFQPSVFYQRMVRNREEQGNGGEHV